MVLTMSRLTITLPPELHRALKAAAAKRGTTIGQLVQESVESYGIKPERDAAELVAAARAHAAMDTEAAESLAIGETREARRR